MVDYREISRARYNEILDELGDHEGYCFYREILRFMHADPRMLIQAKCIEIHKWIISEECGLEIGWEEAGNDWVERGYAAVFADLYTTDETAKRLYNKIKKELEKT
jgi:hypothetical protein